MLDLGQGLLKGDKVMMVLIIRTMNIQNIMSLTLDLRGRPVVGVQDGTFPLNGEESVGERLCQCNDSRRTP